MQSYYQELVNQIQEKKKLLENINKKQTFQNNNSIIANNNNNQQNNNLNLGSPINPAFIENLITEKINNNSKSLPNINSLQNTILEKKNLEQNSQIQKLMEENSHLKFSLNMKNTNSTNEQKDVMKNLLSETNEKIVKETGVLIETMKDKILNELKPILKTIADMQFFTYKKIKNMENSFSKIRDLHQVNLLPNRTNDNNDFNFANFDEESTEVEKLSKLSKMPEVDDLSNFGVEDNNKNNKNGKTKNKSENSLNNKIKYSKSNRKNFNKIEQEEKDEDEKFKNTNNLKKERFNDP